MTKFFTSYFRLINRREVRVYFAIVVLTVKYLLLTSQVASLHYKKDSMSHPVKALDATLESFLVISSLSYYKALPSAPTPSVLRQEPCKTKSS
ncbi:hypothetical protein GGGNBK_19215 [Sporosarcina sp. ANT_H38]